MIQRNSGRVYTNFLSLYDFPCGKSGRLLFIKCLRDPYELICNRRCSIFAFHIGSRLQLVEVKGYDKSSGEVYSDSGNLKIWPTFT